MLDSSLLSEKFVLCVVPMRLASVRLREKMLAPIGKMSLSQRCVGRALKIFNGDPNVIVCAAVDSEELKSHLTKKYKKLFCVVTDPEIPSGTDRVAVAASQIVKDLKTQGKTCVGVINLQGDIPFAGAAGLKAAAQYFLESSPNDLEDVGMLTLAQDFPSDMDYLDPSAVKVISSKEGLAIYFSRHPVPHSKISSTDWKKQKKELVGQLHIGVYGYTPQILAKLSSHVPVELELSEGLEQLRALWLGIKILVIPTGLARKESFRGIDTKKDLDWARRFCK